MRSLCADREPARHPYRAETAQREARYLALQGDAGCDAAVVGGGLAGLSAATALADLGAPVCPLEARQVGFGASGRNGGQAIHGAVCAQSAIERQLGMAEARRAFDMSVAALDLIRARCARFAIACGWGNGYLGEATSAAKARALRAGADHLVQAFGYPMQPIAAADRPNSINSLRFPAAVDDPRSGHLHPRPYALRLARAAARLGVTIHERNAASAIAPAASPAVSAGDRPSLHTAQCRLSARLVLLTGDTYLQGRAPLYSTATPGELADSLRQRMARRAPQRVGTAISQAWGGFVDLSMDRAPDFRRRSDAPKVNYLQGFTGHGRALTGVAGQLVAEVMAGDSQRFDVFARLRHRPFPGDRWLRTPAPVLGMAWYRMKDALA